MKVRPCATTVPPVASRTVPHKQVARPVWLVVLLTPTAVCLVLCVWRVCSKAAKLPLHATHVLLVSLLRTLGCLLALFVRAVGSPTLLVDLFVTTALLEKSKLLMADPIVTPVLQVSSNLRQGKRFVCRALLVSSRIHLLLSSAPTAPLALSILPMVPRTALCVLLGYLCCRRVVQSATRALQVVTPMCRVLWGASAVCRVNFKDRINRRAVLHAPLGLTRRLLL